MCNCIEPAKEEDAVRGNVQEPCDVGQPTDIKDIKLPEVTQDKEEIIQSQPFEGKH